MFLDLLSSKIKCSACVTPESPTQNPYNRTLSPARRDELARIRQRQLANAVHYIWETGEDKFAFRYFHTGFWESCEKHSDGKEEGGGGLSPAASTGPVQDRLPSSRCVRVPTLLSGEKCRSFIDLTPGETQGELFSVPLLGWDADALHACACARTWVKPVV